MCTPYLASNLHLDTDIKWQRNKICLVKLMWWMILIANMIGFKGLLHTPSSLPIPACGKALAFPASSSSRLVPHHDGLYPGTLGPNKPSLLSFAFARVFHYIRETSDWRSNLSQAQPMWSCTSPQIYEEAWEGWLRNLSPLLTGLWSVMKLFLIPSDLNFQS